jgi:hypothetical protein
MRLGTGPLNRPKESINATKRHFVASSFTGILLRHCIARTRGTVMRARAATSGAEPDRRTGIHGLIRASANMLTIVNACAILSP